MKAQLVQLFQVPTYKVVIYIHLAQIILSGIDTITSQIVF